MTPLMLARYAELDESLRIVKALQDAGAGVNAKKERDGDTVLLEAARDFDAPPDLVKLLWMLEPM